MRLNFLDAFRGRSVFLTGHRGFKGSWLALWLERLGAHVTGYSLAPPSVPSNFVSSQVGGILVHAYDGDVLDFAALGAALETSRADVVIHLAAQALVRPSYVDARATFEVNVMGTLNILDAVRSLERSCVVIIVTSDKCYDNSVGEPSHTETDPLGGNDPYSASKAAAEIVTAAYRKSFFSANHPATNLVTRDVKLASVRAGNVIGGGDWAADRIVPDAVRALASGETIALRNPGSIRAWQHVLEPLSGYLTLAARMLSSDDATLCSGWNFGPSAADEATVDNLAEALCRAWGNGKWRSAAANKQFAEERTLRLSSERARTQLGWEPRWTFGEAVERTARWYRAFYDHPGDSTRDLCLQDIADYEAAGASARDDLVFAGGAGSGRAAGRVSR
jgi:CDP-glucose 4,6-dehydratase